MNFGTAYNGGSAPLPLVKPGEFYLAGSQGPNNNAGPSLTANQGGPVGTGIDSYQAPPPAAVRVSFGPAPAPQAPPAASSGSSSTLPILLGAGAVLALLYLGNEDKKRRRR